ncbi:MAG: hypothetical protein SPL98_03210, partial [Bacteroidales bacterium]|nr:hypothetical protein [Bacteroidales bacterium]
SIGAMIIFLLWIYLNSYIILIGFELNASIADAYTQGRALNNKDENGKKALRLSRSAQNMSSLERLKKDYKRWYIRKVYPKIKNLKRES